LAIFEVDKPGRHPDGVIPALVHGTKVMDFRWDPFDNTRLAVGCDDGRICIWTIPDAGLVEQTNEPDYSIYAHSEKIFFVRFHPLAKDVLASGSYDLAIRIWDLDTKEARILIQLDNTQVTNSVESLNSKTISLKWNFIYLFFRERFKSLVLSGVQKAAGLHLLVKMGRSVYSNHD